MAGEHIAQSSSLLTIPSNKGRFVRGQSTDVQCSAHNNTTYFRDLPTMMMTWTANPPQHMGCQGLHHCGLSVESVAGLVFLVSPVSFVVSSVTFLVLWSGSPKS